MPGLKHAPVWHKLQHRRLVKSVKEVLDYDVKSRTVKAAYAEVVALLEPRGLLEYQCRACGSLLPESLMRCWACGRSLPPPAPDNVSDLKNRAFELGISNFGALNLDELKKAVDLAERKIKELCDRDLLEIEPIKLNEHLSEIMPAGWRKRESSHYTSYYDTTNTKRITVPYRGLRIQFAVEDDFFKGSKNMSFSDAQDRKRLHLGRSNYMYTGDIFKEIVEHCEKIFETYNKEEKNGNGKKTKQKTDRQAKGKNQKPVRRGARKKGTDKG